MYEKKRPELEINAAAKNKFWADREVSRLSFFLSERTTVVV